VPRLGLPLIAAAAVGGIVVARTLTRRRRPAPVSAPGASDPRADELRRKLAESRDLSAEREEFEAAETPVDRAEPVVDPDARRREIHERGRAAAEEMRGGDGAG
jgi:hypothetical protein